MPRGRAKRSSSVLENETETLPPAPKRSRTGPLPSTTSASSSSSALIDLGLTDDEEQEDPVIQTEASSSSSFSSTAQNSAVSQSGVEEKEPKKNVESPEQPVERKVVKAAGRKPSGNSQKPLDPMSRSSTADDFFSLSSKAPSVPDFSSVNTQDDEFSSSSEYESESEARIRRKYRKKEKFLAPPKLQTIEFTDPVILDEDDDDDVDVDLLSSTPAFPKKPAEPARSSRPLKSENVSSSSLVKDDIDLFTEPSSTASNLKLSKELRDLLSQPLPSANSGQSFLDLDEEVYRPDPELLTRASSLLQDSGPQAPVVVHVLRREDPRKPFPPENTPEGQKCRKPIKFKIFNDETFSKLFGVLKSFLEKEGIKSETTLWFKGVRIYSSTLPQSLRLQDGSQLDWSNAELDVYRKKIATDEEAKTKQKHEEEIRSIEIEAMRRADQVSMIPVEAGVNLKIRFPDGSIEKVRVKKTSTFKALKIHLAKKKNVDFSRISLKVDGDHVGNEDTVEDQDLEDDNILEGSVN